MPPSHFRRVGAVRPSHLMFTAGVGSLVDLPNISVLIRGLDDWNYKNVTEYEPIAEPRLLKEIRDRVHPTVKELKPAPWTPGLDNDPAGPASKVGVPTMPFPGWLRCTVCAELGPIDSQAFGFVNSNPRRPHDARFVHSSCPRRKSKPLAVPARFVLACGNGHLDDFPYREFVHGGDSCPKASHPKLRMADRGGNLGVNVELHCQACAARKNLGLVFQSGSERHLPACRGRHAHLSWFDSTPCDQVPKVLVVGASNQWFARTMTVLSVPPTGASELQAKVVQHWETLRKLGSIDMLPFARAAAPVLAEFEKWSDPELWAAIEKRRQAGGEPEDAGSGDLKTPEWQVFTDPKTPDPTDDFTLRRDPEGVPAALKECYADVVQAERLREVRALVGFTRLDAPDPADPDLVRQAPLSRGPATWVPASEVRGEGIFLRLPEEQLAAWEQRVRHSEVMLAHQEAYARFRRNRYSGRVAGGFDPMKHWPGARFYALHTLSHLLIRTIALECGYSPASLAERIYPGFVYDPQAGILIYTAVPDAEGTLGGLVSLAEPDPLVRITRRALTEARHCSSDPLCAERLPQDPADFLHGAACHICLFVSETTCERGNRFLDRRLVVPVDRPELALFPEAP